MYFYTNFRGTKEFLVSVATESDPDTWIPVTRGKLADIRGVPCTEQPGKRTFHFVATQARYARFEVLAYYGKGAVLQYFDMD